VTLLVRPATTDDAPALAELHVRTWQATYAGIVPQRVLDGLSIERRKAYWLERLSEAGENRRTFVAIVGGRPGGFVTAGVSRDDDLLAESPNAGEVYAIYVAPWAQAQGVGRALMDAALDWLREHAREPIALWVIVGNETGTGFYEHLGFRRDGARQPIDFDGTPVDEIRFRLGQDLA
jgi:GNAT superfamily N-acetyltransferase